MYFLLVLILIVIYLLYRRCMLIGFSVRPSEQKQKEYINVIKQNKQQFATGSYTANKKKYDWLDPVLHEDIRYAIKHGKDLNLIFA